MKYLVTGAGGFLGAHLVRRLTHLGHVDSLVRGGEPAQFGGVHYDVVFHTAAELNEPVTMYESNVDLTYQVISTLSYTKCIVTGSCSEYGKVATLQEDEACRPQTWYALTKAMATDLCRGYARQFDKDVCVARLFSVYGNGDRRPSLLNEIKRAALSGRQLRVLSGAHDWMYVGDCVEALLTLATADPKRSAGDVVNIGTGISTTNLEFVSTAEDVMNVVFDKIATPGGFEGEWKAETTRANSYGIRCETNLKDGLRKSLLS